MGEGEREGEGVKEDPQHRGNKVDSFSHPTSSHSSNHIYIPISSSEEK